MKLKFVQFIYNMGNQDYSNQLYANLDARTPLHPCEVGVVKSCREYMM